MRVAFISEDFYHVHNKWFPGGCAWYRCWLPMRAAGPNAAFGMPLWTGEHGFGVQGGGQATKAKFGFDVVVLKMMMARWIPHQIHQAKRLGQRIIVDVDDAYTELHEANLAFHTTDPNSNRVRNREIQEQVIALADTVTVSTPWLLDYYSSKHPDVRMIRNGVDPNQFTRRRQPGTNPVLGWAASLKWRSNDAETARGWLNDFLTEHQLMFHHAGHVEDAQPLSQAAGVDPARVVTSPMRPIFEYQNMLTFDIGLVLLSDIAFNHAKSCIKGLEYAAAGIPFVAYATPEYQRLADMGVGRVARTPDEWIQHLTDLLPYKTRNREAAINMKLVRQEHSIAARIDEWKAVLHEGTPSKLRNVVIEL